MMTNIVTTHKVHTIIQLSRFINCLLNNYRFFNCLYLIASEVLQVLKVLEVFRRRYLTDTIISSKSLFERLISLLQNVRTSLDFISLENKNILLRSYLW